MIDNYSELSGFVPENESDIMLRLRVLAGEIFKERAYAEYILRQMFPVTAEGTYLDEHAAQRNIIRKTATKASGRVTFITTAEEHGDIIIPAGTVICTNGDMKQFVTDDEAVIEAESQSCNTSVTAAEAGSAYNVAANTIEIIVTPVIGVDAVSNPSRFTGGSDAESDEELRERIKDSYVNISNGTNEAYYRSVAMSVSGVYSASAVGRARGAGTINVYACGKGTELPASKLSEIEALLREARELNVDVRVFSPTAVDINLYIKLSVKAGYSFDEVADEIKASVTEFINGLGIGRDVMLNDIGEIIYHTKGVETYKFLESYGSDTIITKSQYPVADNILVRSS